jgi:hypothetical protein
MIYLFNLPAKFPSQISSNVAIDINKIAYIGPIHNTAFGATFDIILSIKEKITIICPSETAQLLETERQQLITTWSSFQNPPIYLKNIIDKLDQAIDILSINDAYVGLIKARNIIREETKL